MKRENLIGYMEDPSLLNQSSLPEVEELVESFPYFQTAHMLLARNLHNLDSVKFHDILRSTAAFAGDRAVLYHLIHKAGPKMKGQEVPEDTGSGIITEDPQGTGNEGTVSAAEIEPGPEGGLSGKLAEILSRETGDLELEYSPPYSLEETTPPTIEEYTFTGWFDHIHEVPAAQDAPSGRKDLIEKFLEEQPGIGTDPEKSPDQTDRSEASAEAGEALMTETLAKIYLKQGLYKKAIYAYEKLSLKYPEKNTYFAAQINRIKSNLENE